MSLFLLLIRHFIIFVPRVLPPPTSPIQQFHQFDKTYTNRKKLKKNPETPNPNYCVSHHPRPPERHSVVVSINWQPSLKPPTISHIFPPPISRRDPRKPAAKLPHTALRFTVFRHRLPATATARLFLIILSILLDHLLQQPTPFTEIEVKPPTTSFSRLFRPIHDDPRQRLPPSHLTPSNLPDPHSLPDFQSPSPYNYWSFKEGIGYN